MRPPTTRTKPSRCGILAWHDRPLPRDYAALRELARVQEFSRLHEHPDRAGVPIDTIRIDRCDFPEQSLASLRIDGEPCLKLG